MTSNSTGFSETMTLFKWSLISNTGLIRLVDDLLYQLGSKSNQPLLNILSSIKRKKMFSIKYRYCNIACYSLFN